MYGKPASRESGADRYKKPEARNAIGTARNNRQKFIRPPVTGQNNRPWIEECPRCGATMVGGKCPSCGINDAGK